MDRAETKEAIAVMQHYADGGELESKGKSMTTGGSWFVVAGDSEPLWDWPHFDYRIKRRSGECWAGIGDGGLYVFQNQDAHITETRVKIRWEEC